MALKTVYPKCIRDPSQPPITGTGQGVLCCAVGGSHDNSRFRQPSGNIGIRLVLRHNDLEFLQKGSGIRPSQDKKPNKGNSEKI